MHDPHPVSQKADLKTETTARLTRLLDQAARVLDRVEGLLPAHDPAVDWSSHAFVWQCNGRHRQLRPIARPHDVRLADLLCMDRQKAEIVRNTRQFAAGSPANNVLLWGARGTGKSTLIKAVFNGFREQGVRLLEVDKEHLVELPRIIDQLHARPERFILFCDDLSFEADDARYKSLKAVLDGSVAAPPENILIYATSNRRHLLPEAQADNQDVTYQDGELHPGDSTEEKISLSERFGLWLSFYPFTQDQYLEIVDHWLQRFSLPSLTTNEDLRQAALRWARYRGSRSGRVARQFVVDQLGRQHP